MSLDRFIPPHSLEAEMATVGCMILGTVEEVLWLRSEMFYQPAHRMVFQAVRALHKKGAGIDLVTVRDALKSKGLLSDCGGLDYLVQLVESVPTTKNANYYAEIVRDKWKMRELQNRSQKFLEEQLFDPETDADEKVSIAAKIADGLRGDGESEVLPGAVKLLDDAVAPGIATGLMCIDLNSLSGGLYPGEYNVFAGKTGSGKTNMLVQVALCALRAGKSVVFNSKELTGDKVIRRFMRQMCGESSADRAASVGRLDEWDAAAKEFERFDLRIWDANSGDRTVESFVERITSTHAKRPADLVCDDYFQLFESRDVKPRDGGKTPVMEHAERLVRATNLKLGNVWAIGSQVTTKDGEAYTANSQELEKGAAMVNFIVRDGERDFKLYNKKNRDGESNWTAQMEFDTRTLTFRYVPPPEPPVSKPEYSPFDGEVQR